MEEDLNGVASWVLKNHVKLSVKRTQLLLLGRRSMKHELEGVEFSDVMIIYLAIYLGLQESH